MAEGLYCYQCEQGYPVAIHPPRCNDLGDRVCPQCASDFIELRQVRKRCLARPMHMARAKVALAAGYAALVFERSFPSGKLARQVLSRVSFGAFRLCEYGFIDFRYCISLCWKFQWGPY